MAREPVSAIILAGGRARRFGGQDKGLIGLHGKPLVQWAADDLAPQVSEIVLSANRNQATYASLGYPVVADSAPDHPGPLAGILAAASHTSNEWVLTSPCDTPFLPSDLASRLLDQARSAGVPLARAADPEQIHFTVMLLHRSLLPDLAEFVATGGRQVQAWQARQHHRDVTFVSSPWAFFNINTPDDLRRAEHHVANP
jgi:molybdopterin-guanine dinucleotide biosynthesis protein A